MSWYQELVEQAAEQEQRVLENLEALAVVNQWARLTAAVKTRELLPGFSPGKTSEAMGLDDA